MSPTRRRAGPRDWLRALGSLLVLAAVVVGVPGALLLTVGSPVPTSSPGLHALTSQLDAPTVLRLLTLVVWLAWAHFVICTIVEWRAEMRGVGMPGHVPFGGASQLLARRLVAATLLIAGSATLAAPALAPAPHRSTTVAAGAAAGGAQRPGAAAGANAGGAAGQATSVDPVVGWSPPSDGHGQAARPGHALKYYDVQPPQGRHYDTLWGIAERFLGNGLRYKEVFTLNQGRVQPDGRALEKPDLIRPGWALMLPADAQGPGLRVIAAPVTPTAPGGSGSGGTSGSSAHPGGVVAPIAQPDRPDRTPGPARGLAGAGLLAAGVLVALRRRRLRLDGMLGHASSASGGDAEVALRLAAETGTAAFLDRALRTLAAGLTADRRALPRPYAARLDDDALQLYLATAADGPPPAPWTTGDGGRSWQLDRSAGLPEVAPGMPAPYPGLATFGTVDDAWLLLDLEASPGMVTIGGDLDTARDVVVSVAVELATNLWSDDIRVCMVGFGDDLQAVAPDRIRHVDTLTEAVRTGEERAGRQRATLASAGLDTVLQGRQVRQDYSLWAPEVLVLSAPPSADEAALLAELAADHRRSLAVLGVGDSPAARWRFVATADGRLSTGVLGIELDAQTLPVAEYGPLVELFREVAAAEVPAARPPSGDRIPGAGAVPGGAGPVGPVGAGPVGRWAPARPVDLDHRPVAEIQLLGPVVLRAEGPIEAARVDLCTEIAAFLGLHPDGVHPTVLAGAIWPRGVSDQVRDATLGHLGRWLGSGPDGRQLLVTDESGRLWLADAVACDWDAFRTRLARADRMASGAVPGDERAELIEALRMLRGPLWSGLPDRRYAWLARLPVEAETRAATVAAARRLAARSLAAGDGGTAEAAIRAGLFAVPAAEELWQDLLRVVAGRGERRALRDAVDAAYRGLSDPGVGGASAETDALVDEVLPGYRLVPA